MELICTKASPQYFSGNPCIFEWVITPYSQQVANQNPYVIITIERTTGSGSVQIDEKKVFPDANGKFSIDVGAIADSYLKYFIPPHGLNRHQYANDQRIEIFVNPKIYIGTQELTLSANPVQSQIILKGGLSYEYTAPVGNYEPHVDSFGHNRSPLAFFNNPERIFKEDVFFLYFIKPANFGVNVLYEYALTYFLIDEMVTVTGTIETIALTAGRYVIAVPAGYNQLGLEAHLPSGAVPVSYSLQVRYNNSPYNVVMIGPVTFKLDHRKFYNSYQLLYRNSLGGLQPLRLLGAVDFEAEYNGETGQRVAPDSYITNGNLEPQQSTPWNEEQPKFTGNTGFLDKFEADRMRDLFLSRQVFEVKDNRLIPVVINKGNVKFFSNNDSLINVQVDWQHAFINNFFSPKILPDATCPAMISLAWRQSGDNQITVFYQLPFGYDYCRIKIKFTYDNSEQEFFVDGNSGSAKLDYTRPSGAPDPTSIIVSGQVVCNRYNATPSYGAATTLSAANIAEEFAVVALDDYMPLPKGYSTAVTLPLSALLNDYDPDGGPIEAIPVTGGATNDGGVYDIAADGEVTYTPPSSSYTGTDYFDYQVKKTGGSVLTTARYRINVY